MSDLLEPRTAFRPLQYPWAYEFYQQQTYQFWIKEKISFDQDVTDWEFRLTAKEKHLLMHLFRFFVTADVDVGAAYLEKYAPMFKAPEVRMMLSQFAAYEAIHIDSYDTILQTVGIPDVEYSAFAEYQAMAEKHEYLWSSPEGLTEKQQLAFGRSPAFLVVSSAS